MTTDSHEDAARKLVDDLKLSSDELDKLTKAFKDPEFKKLFKEYADEISDPENRKRYEEEIRQLECERGMDVKFINPTPDYVLKTSQNGNKKVFINICHCDIIGKPSVQKASQEGKTGAVWSIPHSLSSPREDVDKEHKLCVVYDIVFHPDTLYMASKNVRFRELVESTALKGIEERFNTKLDHKNVHRPKLKFKGVPQPTVLRTKRKDFDEKQAELTEQAGNGPLGAFPYPQSQPSSSSSVSSGTKETHKASTKDPASAEKSEEEKLPEPKYTIRYSEDFDLQKFRADTADVPGQRPDKIIVTIELPLLKSASCIDLDIKERLLVLHVEKPAAYHLKLKLSYPVLEDEGSAKFDKNTRRLIVTLPIRRDVVRTQKRLDSGIEEGVDNSDEDHFVSSSALSVPLIEVLSESSPSEPVDEGVDSNSNHVTVQSSSDFISLCKFQKAFPEVRFTQDWRSVSVWCAVRGVSRSRQVSMYHDGQVLLLQCNSMSSGCFPMLFGVELQLGQDLVLMEPEVTLHEDHVLVTFTKNMEGYWKEIRYRSGVEGDWIVNSFASAAREESNQETLRALREASFTQPREECISPIQFLTLEESSVISDEESSKLATGELSQDSQQAKSGIKDKKNKKKKNSKPQPMAKEKRPSRDRTVIAEEEKMFSELVPIDQESVPEVEFSDTTHLQCNSILKVPKLEMCETVVPSVSECATSQVFSGSGDDSSMPVLTTSRSISNASDSATSSSVSMTRFSSTSSNASQHSRTGSLSLPKSVSFGKGASHVVDTTWYDCSESVAQLRKRLQTRRSKEANRRCRRRSHNAAPDNMLEEDEKEDNSASASSIPAAAANAFRNRSFSETEVSYMKEQSRVEAEVSAMKAVPPSKEAPKKVAWKEVKPGAVKGRNELQDMNSGEVIREHRTQCRVDLSTNVAFTLDADE